jgi:hypothetical protein
MDPFIKLRKKLATDGRVIALSRALRGHHPRALRERDSCAAAIFRAAALGAVAQLWMIGDDHADPETGELIGYSPADLDGAVGIPGFTKSLPAEWCRLDGERIFLVNYGLHNGTTAKARAQQSLRDALKGRGCAPRSARGARPRAARDREEKSREENKETPLTPQGGQEGPRPRRRKQARQAALEHDPAAHPPRPIPPTTVDDA